MARYEAALFGKFLIKRDGRQLVGMEARKVKELLGYLLVSRGRPQPRENLAELLWADQPPAQSRKNLRQTLWKLKSALGDQRPADTAELLADPEWVQLDPSADWWLDIAEFEQAFASLQNKRVRELNPDEFRRLERAADLYRGDLLEGWYQDWCLFERERYQGMYLTLLHRLALYCEVHRRVQTGIMYGEKLLQRDRAHERGHRQMMRLYAMAGDRTRALRQYERCAAALRDELGIEPSERTVKLFQQIKADDFQRLPPTAAEPAPSNLMLRATAERLDRFAEALTHLQAQVQREIASLENRPERGG